VFVRAVFKGLRARAIDGGDPDGLGWPRLISSE
jgi:hypothetical protein